MLFNKILQRLLNCNNSVCISVFSAEKLPRLSYHSHIAFFTLWLHTKTDWSRTQAANGHTHQTLRSDDCCLCCYQREKNKPTQSLQGHLDGRCTDPCFFIYSTMKKRGTIVQNCTKNDETTLE